MSRTRVGPLLLYTHLLLSFDLEFLELNIYKKIFETNRIHYIIVFEVYN